MSNIGEKIKEIRLLKGMTQTQFAGKIHLSRKTLGLIEQGLGKVDNELLNTIAEAMGVPKEEMQMRVGSNVPELRDEFAKAALNGLMAGRPFASDEMNDDQICAKAWAMADKMMEHRGIVIS